jgi:hypothetical protein
MSASSSVFTPFLSFIEDISQAINAVVTFTAPHSFIVGQLVSFRVSPASGMFEMNNQDALVIDTTSTTITVPINTTNYTAYVMTGPYIRNPAICVPAGSGILPNSVPVATTLQDAFDNVPTP